MKTYESSVEIENMKSETGVVDWEGVREVVRERLGVVGEKQLRIEAERVELEGDVRAVKEALKGVEREIGELRRRKGEVKAELKAVLEDLKFKDLEENNCEKTYQSSLSDLYSAHQAHISRLQTSISSQQQQLISYQLHATDLSRKLLQIRLSRPSPTAPSIPSLWTMTFGLISGFIASSLFFLPL